MRIVDDPRYAFAEAKVFLAKHTGLTLKDEPRLEDWYADALERADRMLRRDFTDDDGNDVEPTEKVVTAIRLAIADGIRALKLEDNIRVGIVSASTGGMAESYGAPRTTGGVLARAMAGRLRPLALKPWLWGKNF